MVTPIATIGRRAWPAQPPSLQFWGALARRLRMLEAYPRTPTLPLGRGLAKQATARVGAAAALP